MQLGYSQLLPAIDLGNQSHLLEQAGIRSERVGLSMHCTFILASPRVSSLLSQGREEGDNVSNLITQLTDGQNGKDEHEDFASSGGRRIVAEADSQCSLGGEV